MNNDRFIVITSSNAEAFQEKVNEALSNGYVLHGNPEFKATSHQDTWNERQRSWSEHHYCQCMIKN